MAAAFGLASAFTAGRTVLANDDFPQFEAARRYGLSTRLLEFNVFQHFAPINRAAHWLAISVDPLNATVAWVMSLAMVGWFLAAFGALLGVLGTSSRRRAVLIVVSGTSVPLLDTASWFDGAMQWFPLLGSLTTFLWLHVRFLQRRSLWNAAAAALGLALCMAADIRFVMALPIALLVDVCLVRSGVLRERLRQASANTFAYLAGGALLLWAALTISRAYTSSRPLPPLHLSRAQVDGQILWYAMSSYVPTRLFGVWFVHPLPPFLAAITVAAIAGLGVRLIRHRRTNGYPMAVALVGGLLPYLLLYESDLLSAGAAWSARRSDYMLLTILALLLAGSKLEVPARWVPLTLRCSSTAAVSALAVAVMALPAAVWSGVDLRFSGLVSTRAAAYLENVRAGHATWADPRNTVVDLRAPRDVALARDTHAGDQRFLLSLIDPGLRGVAPLRKRLFLIDDTGRILPAELSTASIATVGLGCTGTSSSALKWPRRIVGGPLDLLLSLTVDRPVILRLKFRAVGDKRASHAALAVAAGRTEWLVPIGTQASDGVSMATAHGSPLPCITSARIVRPVMVLPHDVCMLAGPDGSHGPVLQCPTPASPRSKEG